MAKKIQNDNTQYNEYLKNCGKEKLYCPVTPPYTLCASYNTKTNALNFVFSKPSPFEVYATASGTIEKIIHEINKIIIKIKTINKLEINYTINKLGPNIEEGSSIIKSQYIGDSFTEANIEIN